MLTIFLQATTIAQLFLLANAVDVKSWLTQSDLSGNAIHLLEPQASINAIEKSNNQLEAKDGWSSINIDQNSRFQKMEGFGAGLPQASASVLYNLKKRNNKLYEETMQKLFSKDNGVGINILRFPIGSCDFSIHNTTYDEIWWDWNLEHFAIDSDSEMIVSVLQDVQKINSDLLIIASPWSAPSWLKTWQTLIAYSNDNTLVNDDYFYDTYAKYLIRVLEVYRDRGLNIQYLTLQNEPLFGTSSEYPGMYLSKENAVRLQRALLPKLKDYNSKNGRSVSVLAYDHNWDHPEYPEYALSQGVVDSVAWHCYGGDMKTAHEYIHSRYPSARQFVTECTGSFPDDTCNINNGMVSFGYNHEWDMSNILLGATSHWSSSGLKWILALDENCGPTLPLVSYKNGRPLVSVPSWAKSSSDIKWNQDYWSIGHMSKFIPRGSYRVSSSLSSSSNVISETFVNPKTNQLSLLVMNTDHSNTLKIGVWDGKNYFESSVPAFSTKVFQWSP